LNARNTTGDSKSAAAKPRVFLRLMLFCIPTIESIIGMKG
jgi:hypothetical protein